MLVSMSAEYFKYDDAVKIEYGIGTKINLFRNAFVNQTFLFRNIYIYII